MRGIKQISLVLFAVFSYVFIAYLNAATAPFGLIWETNNSAFGKDMEAFYLLTVNDGKTVTDGAIVRFFSLAPKTVYLF